MKDKVWKHLYDVNDLAGRTRRFREKAASIAWDPTEGSEKLKDYMDARLTRLLGDERHSESIKSLPNLFDLRAVGLGKAPQRVRATATAASKKYYADKIKRQAGLPIDTPMTDATTDVEERSTNPGPLTTHCLPSGESVVLRNDVPATLENLALFNRLGSTAVLYGRLMGYEQSRFVGPHTTLFSRWIMIQRELYANWRDGPPSPAWLRRWVGGIKNSTAGQ